MNRQLRKLISFTAAAAVLANGVLLSADAAYVGERVTENDFDSLVSMQDKDILIENGSVESVESGDQLVVIDKDGNKKLISLEEGITGVYTYTSTTLGQYNFLSPTPAEYSFDFFDPNYQLSTEQGIFIAGIGDKFALMDNDGKVISKKYDQIAWLTDGFYLVKNGDSAGVIDLTGEEVITVLPENEDIKSTSDGNYFILYSSSGCYFSDHKGKKLSSFYDDINEYKSFYDGYDGELFFKVTGNDGKSMILDSSLNAITGSYDQIYYTGKGRFSLNSRDESGSDIYTLIDREGKVIAEDVEMYNEMFDYKTDSDYYTVIRKGDTYSVLDAEYNTVLNASSYERIYIYGNYYYILDDKLYNGRLEVIQDDFPYELRASGDNYSIWEKDGEFYSTDREFSEMRSFSIPQEDPSAMLDVVGFNSSGWDHTLEVNTRETYISGTEETPDDTSENSNYYSWEFIANDGGKLINTDGYYSVRFSASDDIAIVREEENGPFSAVSMDGDKIMDIPAEYTEYSLVEEGEESIDPYTDEYTFNAEASYNFFINEDRTKFSVYDENMNLIDADVEGYYEGSHIIRSAEPDENGNYKKGMYIPGEGVRFKPIYDDFNFTNDVVIISMDGKTLICDYDKKVIQELDGAYKYNGGSGAAYRTRLTLNCREDDSTKSVVFNSETGEIEFTQEGLYDNVGQFEGDLAPISVYGSADENGLWSENETLTGILRIDGAEMVRPSKNSYLNICLGGYHNDVMNMETRRTETIFIKGDFIFINDSAEPVDAFMPEFAAAHDVDAAVKLSEDNIKVYKNGKWGIFSADGTVLYDITCDYMENHDGILATENEIRYEETYEKYDPDYDLYVTTTRSAYRYQHGLIDMNGKVIADPDFSGTDEYSELYCYFDQLGDEHFSITYQLRNEADRIRAFDFFAKDRFNDMTKNYGYDFAFEAGDLYIVQKDGLQGVADKDNNIIIPVEYTDILSFSKYAAYGSNYDLKKQLAETQTDKLRELSDGSYLLYARTQDNRIRPYIIRFTEDADPDPKVTTTATATTTVQTTTTTVSSVTETQTTGQPAVMTTTAAEEYDVPKRDRTNAEFGDYNCDGMIDASDASEVLMIYAVIQTGGAEAVEPEDHLAGDFDGDGMLTAADASIVLKYYSFIQTGGKMKFAAYLEAGID